MPPQTIEVKKSNGTYEQVPPKFDQKGCIAPNTTPCPSHAKIRDGKQALEESLQNCSIDELSKSLFNEKPKPNQVAPPLDLK